MLMALNGLLCADVPLRNYSLTHSCSNSHPDLCSLAIPPRVGRMSTIKRWGVNRHTTWCTSQCPWSCRVSWCLAED